LGADGVPTERYKRFRNDASSGAAAAEALKIGYGPLYEINEYVHELSDDELKGVIVQATGVEEDASTVRPTIGSFKALRAFAKFDETDAVEEDGGRGSNQEVLDGADGLGKGIALSYTINLHLPPTSDIAVFNAIFKSLREHLLR
jgi:hypothetical protein